MSDQSRTGLRKSHDGQKALQQRPHVSLRASSFFSHEYTNKYKRNTQSKQNLKQELMKGTSFFFIATKAITITYPCKYLLLLLYMGNTVSFEYNFTILHSLLFRRGNSKFGWGTGILS